MIIKGLYIDSWRNLKTQVDCEEILNYANANNYTDVFVQEPVDDAYNRKNPPQIDAILFLTEHKGSLKIHVWMRGISLWRNEFKLDSYPDSWLMTDGDLWYFNPTNTSVQNYLVNKVMYFNDYDIDGFLFDKFYYPHPDVGNGTKQEKKYALTYILRNIKNITGKSLGVVTKGRDAIEHTLNDYDAWYKEGLIDYISPQFCGQEINTIVPKRWTIYKPQKLEDTIYFSYADPRLHANV